MTKIPYFLSCLAAMLFLGGCVVVQSETVTSSATCGPTDWEARLAAADAMSFPMDRDEAYRTLAIHAARANRPDIVKACVSRTSFPMTRDQAASKAAIALVDVGNRQAAVEVADMMSFPMDRDRTLKQIAARP